VENRFRGSPRRFQGIRVYIGERSRSVEPRGAHEGGGRALLPRGFLDLHSKYPGLHLFQKTILTKVSSVWIPFDIPFLRNTEIGKKQRFALGLRLIG